MSVLTCTLHRKACRYGDQNREDKMDAIFNDNEKGVRISSRILVAKCQVWEHLENQSIDGRVIVNWILQEQ